MRTLIQQYKLIQGARGSLFDYLSTLPFEKLHQPAELFGDKSVCYVLNHIATTYLTWLNEFALKNPLLTGDESAWQSINDIKKAFLEVDDCVINFLASFDDVHKVLTGYKTEEELTLNFSVLQLFTHVITHEFHHKAIVLAISRQLGFTPVDTDIIRY